MKIQLSGWKAIAALAAFGAFALIKFGMQSESLGTQGVEEVERWLSLESTRAALPAMQEAVEAGDAYAVARMADGIGEDSFEVVSVTRHGVGERIVARVEYRHEGRSPVDGMNVRYLRMRYSTVTGWRVDSETSKLGYYLAIL